MIVNRSVGVTINVAYVIFTLFLTLCICNYLIIFFGTLSGALEPELLYENDTDYAMSSLWCFAFSMLFAALTSLYNKIFSRISFVVGLMGLASYVLCYNYVTMFRPDMYTYMPY